MGNGDNMMKLQPIAMITPTHEGIYAPSRIKQPRDISQDEFIKRYADHPMVIQVSFEPDGKSNPQQIMAYGYGLDCWYIIT